jgi:hypothetical protein
MDQPRGGGGDEEVLGAGLATSRHLPYKRSQSGGFVEVEQLYRRIAQAALLASVLVYSPKDTVLAWFPSDKMSGFWDNILNLVQPLLAIVGLVQR